MDWTLFWGILYALIIVSTVVVILLENRSPLKAISWVTVLLLLPAVGLVLYLFFGRDMHLLTRRSYKRVREALTPAIPQISRSDSFPTYLGRYRTLYELIARRGHYPLLYADEISTYTDGLAKIDALLADIKQAQNHIHLEYYRYAGDRTGRRITEALKEKAAQGVQIRLLYDHVGSFGTKKGFFDSLRSHGIEAAPFMPVVLPGVASKMNYRNHRKIIVIDGKIGYIGGMNIADDYTYGTGIGKWRDTHFRLTGSAVNSLQTTFFVDWYIATSKVLPPALFGDTQGSTDGLRMPIQIFSSGPTDHFRTLAHALCRAIYSARKRILIHTPYFLPTDSLNKAIISAALSGVEVQLLTPWKSDSPAVKLAARSYFKGLLDAGVHIYQYTSGFLHSKLMTIDDEIAVIGSANMDFRSLEHNYEINAVVYDRTFAEELSTQMLQDQLKGSVEIIPQEWSKRPILTRLLESILRLFAPLF